VFDYLSAGKKAPPEIRAAIARFRRLPLKLRLQTPLLWWLLPEGTPPFKFSQEESAYQPGPKGEQRCANCRSSYQHVTSGTYICDQIRGPIRPEAWCRVWRPPFSASEYVKYQER
jgi:hypothetical protein